MIRHVHVLDCSHLLCCPGPGVVPHADIYLCGSVILRWAQISGFNWFSKICVKGSQEGLGRRQTWELSLQTLCHSSCHSVWESVFSPCCVLLHRTPLHCAASCNNVQVCKFLVESGAAVFAMTYSDMQTAADKCEEMEEGYTQCSQFLYGMGNSIHTYWLLHSCILYL